MSHVSLQTDNNVFIGCILFFDRLVCHSPICLLHSVVCQNSWTYRRNYGLIVPKLLIPVRLDILEILGY